ncbi:MAG TPA: ABC transporter substrate-binding protein [Anaerolineales bacterium]
MFKRFSYHLITLAGLLSLALAACAQVAAPAATATAAVPAATSAASVQPAGAVTLKLAILPILDALPMYVAQQKGYFAAKGVQVQFIPVSSAAERDQIMAAGQADGMINDLISTLFYNKDKVQIQVLRFARTATPQFPQYRILASAKSGITTVAGLKGVPIGISEASVIAYTTDRLLKAEGLKPDEIKTVAVPKMPDRMSLLASGELKAANLPDPLSDLAIQQGAVVIVDDTRHPEYGNSVISFRKTVIDGHPEAIRAFLAAVDQATTEINANPSQWTNLLTEQKLVPASLVGSYKLPTFPGNNIPTEAQWNDVLAWTKEKGLVSVDVSYKDSVNPGFLPK